MRLNKLRSTFLLLKTNDELTAMFKVNVFVIHVLYLEKVWHYSFEVMCASQFQPRATPSANPGHLIHDESRGPDIWQLIVNIKLKQLCFI